MFPIVALMATILDTAAGTIRLQSKFSKSHSLVLLPIMCISSTTTKPDFKGSLHEVNENDVNKSECLDAYWFHWLLMLLVSVETVVK